MKEGIALTNEKLLAIPPLVMSQFRAQNQCTVHN